MKSVLNHIAILVPSVERAAARIAREGFEHGPAEEWEGEGTLEIYFGGPEQTSRLLLMEPAKDGAYRRATKKRGPGLHHIAIDVLDLESSVSSLSGSGWHLHPRSLETLKKTRTVYLTRSGTPFLVEVQEREQLSEWAPFVSELGIFLGPEDQARVAALGISGIGGQIRATQTQAYFLAGPSRFFISELLE